MRPAFPSNGSAAAFVSLLLLLLLLPAIVGKSRLPTRQEAYATQGWSWAPYPWIRNQIFEETNDIDIVFIGASRMFYGINTPYVQAKLSEKLGRPAVVRTLGWSGGGYDALYFITRDLLEHRRVRLLVFGDEAVQGRGRNPQTPFWFHWHDDAALLSGLPIADQSYYYYAAIIGMPRNLLALIRPDWPAPLVTTRPVDWIAAADSPNPATQLGCLTMRQGFRPTPQAEGQPFEPFAPNLSLSADDALVYASETKTNFEFMKPSLPVWQTHFARELGELLQKYNVHPALLDLPGLANFRSPVIPEREFWPAMFPGGISLLGIPQAKLFGSLTDAEVRKLLRDPYHLNANGEEYFTRAVTPALLKLYETQSGH